MGTNQEQKKQILGTAPGDAGCQGEPPQILQRRSLVPMAEHQELACLLSTKMPPLNRLPRLRFAVAPSCVSAVPSDVAYRRQSRRHVLNVSSSHVDPFRTSVCI